MSGYNELKNAIRRVVKTNNNREITGQNLQSTLTSMVNSLGANYHFAGFASPDTNPGTPDQNIFYIASEEGTYVNFDGINLEPGLSFLMWNSKWSSETISVGEVTKSWVQQNYVSIAFFNELFELYNDSTKIAVNDTIPVDKAKLNIKAMFGFWTEQYISALGKNDSGSSSSGVDMATVWSALAGSTDEQINESHLTTALSEYATTSWVSQIFATITSIPTKLSQLANDTGFITSAALPTKVSQLVNDAGYVTASVINGYATQSWVSQNYVSVEFFERLFQAYSGTTKVDTNSTSAIDNIKAMFGFWTEQYISALGKNDSGSSSSGVDMATVWSALAGSTDEQINKSHITTALSEYATMSWASQIFATVTSIPTKLSQLANDTGFITSAALPTKISQLTNDTGFITSAALPTKLSQLANDTGFITSAALPTNVSQLVNDVGYVTASIVNGYATQSWVSQNYLPLSGGTITEALIIHATTHYNNFDEGIRIQDAPNSWAGITYGATGSTGCSPQSGQVAWFGAKTSEGKFIISPNSSSKETGLTLNNGGDALWRNNIIYHAGNLPAYPTKASWNYDDVYLKLTGGTLTGLNDILSLSSSNENAWIYFKTTVDGSQAYYRASVGYYCGLAFVANEKGFQRIGVNDSGTPQYWKTSYGGSGNVFDLIHTGNISSQSVSNADTVDNLHASSFLRSDTNNTYSNTIIFNTSGYGICVGGIYGYFTNNLIHLYERVNIGYPSGWGGQDAPQYGLSVYGGCSLATNTGSVGIATTSPEMKLDVNGIQQIYERGLDNKAFKDLIVLKAQNSAETGGDNWADTYPTFGIGFKRCWTTSSGNPYGETTCAGIYTTVSASWRGGLVFRTKNNETAGGTHDVTALRLAPSGAATFVSTVTATTFVGSLSGNATSASSCSGNAATATKLQTARTIWGQSFDGSGNVDGALILNYNNSTTNYDEGIRINAVFNNPLIHFGGSGNSGTGANQWTIGLHNNKTFWSLTYDSWSNYIITSNTSGNVGIGTSSPSYKLHVVGDIATTGRAIVDSLQIGNITIIYDAANKGLRIAGGGLYTDSYLSSLGVDASTALSVKKWADSINLTEESDAELATAYSIGNLYRMINSNQESITQSLNQSVSALQGRCTSLEQRVSALENKVN